MVHRYKIDFFLRWRSNTSLLLHFRKPVWILNMCKIQKTFSFPSASQIIIVCLQLRHTKHRVIVWDSIYNWNCYKASFSKWGRHWMIDVWENEVELLSLIHCIYIIMKKFMYSRLISNLSISIVVVLKQLVSWLRDST